MSTGGAERLPSVWQNREVHFTKAFDETRYAQALESWDWVDDIADKVPVLSTLFGDVIFQDRVGFWFLDTVEGTLTQPWTDRSELQASLASEGGQDQYLLAGLAIAAHQSGLVLSDEEVYSFKVPPMLGGQFEVSNVEATSFVVSTNIAGQIHNQLKDLPEDAQITGFNISD